MVCILTVKFYVAKSSWESLVRLCVKRSNFPWQVSWQILFAHLYTSNNLKTNGSVDTIIFWVIAVRRWLKLGGLEDVHRRWGYTLPLIFLTLQFLFAFWVQIYLESYKNTMTITHIILYIYTLLVNDQAKVKNDSIFLHDLYWSVLSKLTTCSVHL